MSVALAGKRRLLFAGGIIGVALLFLALGYDYAENQQPRWLKAAANLATSSTWTTPPPCLQCPDSLVPAGGYPITFNVVYKGQPIKNAWVIIELEKSGTTGAKFLGLGNLAGGRTNANGDFSTTLVPVGDGALDAVIKVRINLDDKTDWGWWNKLYFGEISAEDRTISEFETERVP